MTARLLLAGLVAVALTSAGGWMAGATAASQDPVTLTGCLRTGSATTVFILRGATMGAVPTETVPGHEQEQMPRDYLLVAVPESINLAAHVNHRVALTGIVHEGGSGPAPPEGTNAAERALRRLSVTGMRHVAANCGG